MGKPHFNTQLATPAVAVRHSTPVACGASDEAGGTGMNSTDSSEMSATELRKLVEQGRKRQAHPNVARFRKLAIALKAVQRLAHELADTPHPKRCPCQLCLSNKRRAEGDTYDPVERDLRTIAGIASILMDELESVGVTEKHA